MATGEIDDETYAASEEQDAGTYPGVADQLFPEEEPAGVVTAQGAEELPLPELPPEEQPVAARAPALAPEGGSPYVGGPAMPPAEGGSPYVGGPATPPAKVVTPQQLVQMLDSGFDKLVESARAKQPGTTPRAQPPMPVLRDWGPLTREKMLQSYGGVIGKGEEPGVVETLRGLPASPTLAPEGGSPYVGGPAMPPAEGGSPYVGGPVGARPAAAPAPAAPAPAAARPAATPNYDTALGDRVNPFTGAVRGLPAGMRSDGSMGVVPTAEEIRRPQAQQRPETPLQAAMREANTLFPWASQDRVRAAYVAQRMGEEFKRGTEFGKEDIRGRRTHETEIARTERAERGQTSREQIAADRNEAAARRQQTDLEARNTRQQADFEARSQRLREQQDAITKREMMKAELSTLARQNATFGRLMGEHLRADPSLAANPMELLKRMGPSMQKMGIDVDAVRSRVLMAPSMPAAPGPGAAAPAAGERDPIDAAAAHNAQPGDRIPYTHTDGKTYYYIIQNDGRPVREDRLRK